GGIIGYFIGFGIWEIVNSFFFKYVPFFTESTFQKVLSHYQESGFLYVFLAGFTPIPYKVFTIASGVFKLNFFLFLVASTLSRSLRFFDKTLTVAIVELLKAPVVEGDILLEAKVVSYKMADPELENLSEAQKHLIRMGPENVRKIQAKLREIGLALGIPENKLPQARMHSTR
ncbi:unnamed protein product, partial [marine sediment metagenome]